MVLKNLEEVKTIGLGLLVLGGYANKIDGGTRGVGVGTDCQDTIYDS